MTITVPAVPTPVPQSTDSVNFDARADALVASLPGMVEAMNAQNVENNTINANVNAQATTVQVAAAQVAATMAAQSPVQNAAAAAASATAAAAFASQAQAVSPDTPIRLNSSRITANFTVPANYNAHSAGPIAVAEGVSVTVNNFSTWSIT